MTINKISVSSDMLKRIEKLFMHFDAMYGLVWTKRFNSEDHLYFCKQQWAIALVDVTNQQIHKAIQFCLREKILPPSLPEFKQLCRQYAVACHQAAQPILMPKKNDAIARKHLAVIRITLGISLKEKNLC